jgi:hypothetical protein
MTSSMIQRNNHDEPTVQTANTTAPAIEIAKRPGWYVTKDRIKVVARRNLPEDDD